MDFKAKGTEVIACEMDFKVQEIFHPHPQFLEGQAPGVVFVECDIHFVDFGI